MYYTFSESLPKESKAAMASSSTDRLSCEGLPATQEEIRNASISETHSRVLLIQIQFLVSCSLLKQIFLLLCKNNNGSW